VPIPVKAMLTLSKKAPAVQARAQNEIDLHHTNQKSLGVAFQTG
jgi:hypothetical protein